MREKKENIIGKYIREKTHLFPQLIVK